MPHNNAIFKHLLPMVEQVLTRLTARGYQAFLVGGCVRDALLGHTPKDWDIATNAPPEATEACFADYPLVLAGRKHGTIGVVMGKNVEKNVIEVTTYRVDGAYTDHRHPDEVVFTPRLEEDLARRDFTVNAMAWSPQTGLQDCFAGWADLQVGVVRCVGQPERRFREDALRIVRGARFASTLGFVIEEETRMAMENLCHLLDYVATERIVTELHKALAGAAFADTFANLPELFYCIFKELTPDEAGLQRALAEVDKAPMEAAMRLAVLFGAMAPEPLGAAKAFLVRLRLDKATTKMVLFLLANKNVEIAATEAAIKQWLRDVGPEDLAMLLRFQGICQPGKAQKKLAMMEEIIDQGQCYQLADLAINGGDLLALGMAPGAEIGNVLADLLEAVIRGEVGNEREALLALVRGIIGE